MGKGNKVFELGLHVLARGLPLVGYGIVADIAFAIDLECECVSRRCLQV